MIKPYSSMDARQGNALFLWLLMLATFWLLARSSADAQGLPGYIVKANGDTLRGLVAEISHQRIAYWVRPEAQPQYFTPSLAKAYGVGEHTTFVSRPARLRTGQDSLRFAQPVLVGHASIYRTSFDSATLWLAPPAQDTLYELTSRNWNLLFVRFLSGCAQPNLTDLRVIGHRYTPKFITDLVEQYNRCRQPGWRPQKQKTSFVRSGLHIWAGTMVVANYTYNGAYEGTKSPKERRPGWALGVDMRLLRPDGFWLGLGVAAQQFRGGLKPYQAFTGSTMFSLSYSETYHVSSFLFRLSTGRYFGVPGRTRPFVHFQAAPSFALTGKYQSRYDYSNTLTDFGVKEKLYGNFGAQASLGGGLSVPLSAARELQLSVQYGQYGLFSNPVLRSSFVSAELGMDISSKPR
ncbi:hypothetical protein [Hymenobacter latericus]|uniref:hypothetical protein n=1 Tax=Hymenobacter sp. YIM 151858-1 TaxID=2987688 RepID=UPI002227DF41|nr:hypothetical protein [Hymenobacter sp. YIM 151858-1]UYZ59598.1 hypothetical protein OIS50_02095 [Hymenobacter sp. YIM 151858-1]